MSAYLMSLSLSLSLSWASDNLRRTTSTTPGLFIHHFRTFFSGPGKDTTRHGFLSPWSTVASTRAIFSREPIPSLTSSASL